MSNSLFVPLTRAPVDIAEVELMIHVAFAEFHLPAPVLRLDAGIASTVPLIDRFILINSPSDSDQCWVSLSRCDAEVTGNDECTMLADVKTRGNWTFAGVVAYAFSDFAGTTVFNDSGELDGRESYSAEELREVIRRRLEQRDCGGAGQFPMPP